MTQKMLILLETIKPMMSKLFPGLTHKELTRPEFYLVCREAGCLDSKGRWTIPEPKAPSVK